MKPEFVYFDLGNVLVHFSHRLAADQIARVAGIDPELAWRIIFEGELQTQLETGAIDSTEFCRRLARLTGSQFDCAMLVRAASDIFWLNEPIVPVVSQLAAGGVRMGILSNTCAAHWQHVCSRFALLTQWFPVSILSFEVGSMKPDPKIYGAAVRSAGVAPERILFVDDRPDNVTGALAAGFDAHTFHDVPQLRRLLVERALLPEGSA